MVRVREQSHITPTGEIDLERWLAQLPTLHRDDDEHRLLEACRLARVARDRPGRDLPDWAHDPDCFAAGLDIALILAELHVGTDCLIAGNLYRAVVWRRGQPPAQRRTAHGRHQ